MLADLNPSWFIAAGSISSAFVGLVSLFIAWRVFINSRKALAPDVRVLVALDEYSTSFIKLLIQNVGKSVAYDVKFGLSKPIPERAFGFIEGTTDEERAASLDRLRNSINQMTTGPLYSGIPAFAPGDKREMLWGSFGGISSWLGDNHVDVIASYRDQRKKKYETKSVLEVKSFKDLVISDNNPLKKIHKAIEDLGGSLRIAGSDSKPVYVISETPRQRTLRLKQYVAQLGGNSAHNS